MIDLKINKPSLDNLKQVINNISKKENLTLSNTTINKILEKCNSDYRHLIQSLYEYSLNKNQNIDQVFDILKHKDIDIDLYESVYNLFNQYILLNNTVELNESGLISNMLHENNYQYIIDHNSNKKKKVNTLIKIYKTLSETQEFNNFNNLSQYSYYYTCKRISYLCNDNKLKKPPNINITLNFPKINNIINSRNQFLKSKTLFESHDIYFKLIKQNYIIYIEYIKIIYSLYGIQIDNYYGFSMILITRYSMIY